MTISDVVRMALIKGSLSTLDLAPNIGVGSRNAVSTKLARESWTANELAIVAELSGGKLLIRYPDGQEIPVEPVNNKKADE